MANEVTINVKSNDQTNFDAIKAKTRREMGKAGDEGGKSFGASVRRWFTGDGVKAGQFGATAFGSGFLGALKTPVLGPAMAGIIGGAALVAMPVAGAVAAGALVAGFGAGLAGLGIMFAAKSQVVQDAWTSTLDGMSREMTRLSEPFEDTLVSMSEFAKRTFDAFAPALGTAFEKMAGPIETFADDASRAFENLIPAIAPLTDGFNAVLATLGPALQSAITSVANGLSNLGRSVEANPQALADMVRAVGDLSGSLVNMLAGLNSVYGSMRNLSGIIGPLTGGLATMAGGFGGFMAVATPIPSVLSGIGASSAQAGASMLAAADAVTRNAQAMQGQGAAASAVVGPNDAVNAALVRQKNQFSAAITAMGQWSSAALAASGSAISYEAAIDDATASVKANGRTLDISTEKGRANRTALNNVAAAANAQAVAMDNAGASNKAVAGKANTARANFVKLATSMGMSKGQAAALAAQLIAIPNVSRTVTITTTRRNIFIEERIIRDQTGGTGGRAPTHAAGGMPSPGRSSWVGEFGPELVQFPPGAHVRPAGESRRMARAAAGREAAEVIWKVEGGRDEFSQFLVGFIKRYVRITSGGDVQKAFT